MPRLEVSRDMINLILTMQVLKPQDPNLHSNNLQGRNDQSNSRMTQVEWMQFVTALNVFKSV